MIAVEAGWSGTAQGFRGSVSSLMIVVAACQLQFA